jgi:UrcA family protein
MRIRSLAFFASAALGLAAAPAFAQSSVGELTVTGRLGEASRLSAVVSYADLDLTTRAGQDVLTMRIKDTAHDLCRQLGESDSASTPLVPSCEEGAVRDARAQVRTAVAMATPKPYAIAPATGYGSDASATVRDEPMIPPAVDAAAIDPASYDQTPTYSTQTVTNGPVADTPANRARYGQPMSNAGRRTTPAGN